jgi:hypothetical protein
MRLSTIVCVGSSFAAPDASFPAVNFDGQRFVPSATERRIASCCIGLSMSIRTVKFGARGFLVTKPHLTVVAPTADSRAVTPLRRPSSNQVGPLGRAGPRWTHPRPPASPGWILKGVQNCTDERVTARHTSSTNTGRGVVRKFMHAEAAGSR